MDNTFYYVWLSKLYFIKSNDILCLVSKYESLGELYKENINETFKNIKLNNVQRNMYENSKNKEKILRDIELMKKEKVGIIYYYDDAYPKMLKEIFSPPVVIYYKGNKNILELPSVSIVGSRNCSEYGIKVTRKLSSFFSGMGLCITSGMALGIDAEAHKSALNENGNTIAVLGCGINVIYPKDNEKLKESIESKGCILSEFPLYMQAVKINFPRRNRIISGLSSDIIVVEAEEKSGSLITAHYAMEQNRNVYSVPGSIYNKNSMGCNKLINEGAYLLENEFTVIQESYQIKKYVIENNIKINKSYGENIKISDCEERKIYDILIEKRSLNYIIKEMDMDVMKLQRMLTNMEIKGLIKRIPGNLFCRMY